MTTVAVAQATNLKADSLTPTQHIPDLLAPLPLPLATTVIAYLSRVDLTLLRCTYIRSSQASYE